MILLAGAAIVLPDRVLEGGTLIVENDRIAAIEPRAIRDVGGATCVDLQGSIVVPGFIDVHVHGVEGHDVLDGPGAVAKVAARLPKFGVTAFCPTSIACSPPALDRLLVDTASAQAAAGESPAGGAARVIAAHLESNFINPEYNGAQPIECLRSARWSASKEGDFAGREILDTIERHRSAVGIVTVAPEIEGGMDLVRRLASSGIRVSIGHSGATYDETLAAIDAGVTHATHLFNRMAPMSHRAPGTPAAVLNSARVRAELICDGFHVHPALMGLTISAKSADRVMAITDGTAGSGLPVGSRAKLGGRPIVVTERTAELADGTMAGSVLTMDGAFRTLVRDVGVSLVDAARMCASTPAAQLGMRDCGRLVQGAIADLVVLDAQLCVRSIYLRGRIWTGPGT